MSHRNSLVLFLLLLCGDLSRGGKKDTDNHLIEANPEIKTRSELDLGNRVRRQTPLSWYWQYQAPVGPASLVPTSQMQWVYYNTPLYYQYPYYLHYGAFPQVTTKPLVKRPLSPKPTVSYSTTARPYDYLGSNSQDEDLINELYRKPGQALRPISTVAPVSVTTARCMQGMESKPGLSCFYKVPSTAFPVTYRPRTSFSNAPVTYTPGGTFSKVPLTYKPASSFSGVPVTYRPGASFSRVPMTYRPPDKGFYPAVTTGYSVMHSDNPPAFSTVSSSYPLLPSSKPALESVITRIQPRKAKKSSDSQRKDYAGTLWLGHELPVKYHGPDTRIASFGHQVLHDRNE